MNSDKEKRLFELQATIYDETAYFSGSDVLAELFMIEPHAKTGGNDTLLATTYDLAFTVLFRSGNYDEAIPYGEKSLKTQEESEFLKPPHSPSRAAYMLGVCFGELGDAKNAVGCFRKSMDLFAVSADIDDNDKLNINYQYCLYLHEAKEFEAAADANKALFEEVENSDIEQKAMKLQMITENLAQNLYELGNLGGADDYLKQSIKYAESDNNVRKVADLYSQRGTLSVEMGDPHKARTFFKIQLGAAKSAGDEDQINEAQASIDRIDKELE